jgi:hypothetical protein
MLKSFSSACRFIQKRFGFVLLSRSSDLVLLELAFPFCNSGTCVFQNDTDFTASGKVEDSHLIPFYTIIVY